MKKKVGLLFLSLLATNLLSVHGQAEETDAIMNFSYENGVS